MNKREKMQQVDELMLVLRSMIDDVTEDGDDMMAIDLVKQAIEVWEDLNDEGLSPAEVGERAARRESK